MRQIHRLLALALVLSLLCACGAQQGAGESTAPEVTASTEYSADSADEPETEPETPSAEPEGKASSAEAEDSEDRKSKEIPVILNGDSIDCSDSRVVVNGTTALITEPGDYLLTGVLENGQIIIDAGTEDEIQLTLDGTSITSQTSAAIYVKSADKVKLKLGEGTVNTLKNGGAFEALDDNNIDGAIFSKDALTLKGSGTLMVESPAGHGIVCKDDLIIKDGTYEITASGHAISAKDSMTVEDGTLILTSGRDGIHVSNNDREERGNILLSSGTFQIDAAGDGISASGTLDIESGSYVITAGGGSENAPAHAEDFGPWGNRPVQDEDEDTISMKGLKAAGNLTIFGGTFAIDSADDALHSNADATVLDGIFSIATGDDGIHADETTTISGGSIDILTSYEGLEGKVIDVTGGYISLYATDDGMNAAGGSDGSGFDGPWGGDSFGGSAGVELNISGGEVHVNADGDGLDSNGNLTISGGMIYISGPTSNGDGALDFDGTGTVTGGTILAIGSSGMTQNFTVAEQGAILVNVGSQAAGTEIVLTDSDGIILFSWTADKAYTAVNLSTPDILDGGTYTLTAGTYTQTISMEGMIYGQSAGFGGMGGPGGRGGF